MPAALTASRVFASLLYGISAADPVSFVAVAAAIVALALVACVVPAARAARLDPLTALRRS